MRLRACRVRLAIENGGSFPTAASLNELLDRVTNPLLGAAYSIHPSRRLSGEDAANGINVLGDRLFSVKLKDYSHGKPCALGEGDSNLRQRFALGETGFPGWVVYEYDRAWVSAPGGPSSVLALSARRSSNGPERRSSPTARPEGVMSVQLEPAGNQVERCSVRSIRRSGMNQISATSTYSAEIQ